MKIIFFDGYCSLCNGLIDFLMKIDRHHTLKFASLQGETAKSFQINASDKEDPDTVIYLREGIRYEKSSAILKIFSDLGGLWKCTKIFWLVPKFCRDHVYSFIAKNRYKLFGKKDTCRLQTKKEQERFLL